MNGKQKLGTSMVFLAGTLTGMHIQSAVVKRRLNNGFRRAFMKCETAQDIVAVEQVLESFIETNKK